jgi:hypothetical protein
MDLHNPFWNDGHFYNVQSPWSIDPNVQQEITSILVLDWVEEEFKLTTQELDQAMSWGCEYHTAITAAITRLGTYFTCLSDHWSNVDWF